ncbi:MAG: sensor histidine kinase [Zymomonas mobilis subsp. pomaceae]|uniref:histidine kinase n=1 Tax=Zymomonas mobilis subsp. pomaceae (strain ATCC 29192 / DSM 22645 / JCM 10191 / CCUG 17912 / NBRC 13757 / NCIMB 11200 / NRRL B-4491 / Barker I) TaxID=579138 RepID=F8ERZ4_ZYMMT|nr:sensor histidine kinase [Zymomonas mobilis]AEI37569.1 signal transduction histidine kinase [Zymomonas mobilis subsp. pomaceae ATCC 29192]MDX5948937.1 sensor histidine kinase [Zymomonas mobilis subsp. pomaceae]GEB88742.1 histidine kinase [Zymomonas mobilis subsp. pomaceae]
MALDHKIPVAYSVLERLPLLQNRPWLGYFCALIVAGGAFLLRVTIDHLLPEGYPFITFMPAILIATFLFGTKPGLITAIISLSLAPHFIEEGVDFNGVLVWFLCLLETATDMGLVVALQHGTYRLRKKRAYNQMLAERNELLFHELQHRISNNLQVIASLLRMQSRSITDQKAKEAIDASVQRIHMIGELQRALYIKNGNQLGAKLILNRLIQDIIASSDHPHIRCTIEAEDLILPSDMAIPLALVSAESVSNALEHGFKDKENGCIDISLKKIDDHIELTISNNGKPLPQGFSLETVDSLGLKIAAMFARQFKGKFTLTNRADQNVVSCLILHYG